MNPRVYKELLILFIDLSSVNIALWLSYSIRLETIFIPDSFPEYSSFFISSILFFFIFFVTGVYNTYFRYFTIDSVIKISSRSLFYLILFFSLILLFRGEVPRSIGIIQPIILYIMMLQTRIAIVLYLRSLNSHTGKNILIYGAGLAGMQTVSNIKLNNLKLKNKTNILGFIDDDKSKNGLIIDGIKVFGFNSISKLNSKKTIDEILIAIPSLNISERRNLVSKLNKLNISTKLLPNLSQLVSGNISLSDFRQVEISDIINRRLDIDPDKVHKTIKGKKVVITGGGGSIGSELVKQLLYANPNELVVLDSSEINLYLIQKETEKIKKQKNLSTCIKFYLLDIGNFNKLNEVIKKLNPDIIYHSAAYKHVNILENSDNSIEAGRNNILGTFNIVNACINSNCSRFILISTDKAVNPSSIMGATKRMAEMIVQAYDKEYDCIMTIVRFGNVLNSSGSVVPLFQKQINNRENLTVTHEEVTRYFMTIPEAVGLILQTNILSKGGEVFVLNMGEPIKIIDLAKKMIRLSGLQEKSDHNPNGDIKIEIIGLKPGEKLYEELLISKQPIPTENKDIFKANETCLTFNSLCKVIDDIKLTISQNNPDKMISIMEKNISNFQKSNLNILDN
tara:strand:+ start:723 stop:2591 length:1869 start_codon:yes stop_codon:yes gene_type:complete